MLGIVCAIAAGTASIGTLTESLPQETEAKGSSSLVNPEGGVTADGYVYQQAFLPTGEFGIDLKHTALFITDPQNDFISEGGAAWDLVGEEVARNNVVEHQAELRKVAKEVGIPVFYSPHMYTERDYATWPQDKMNGIDKAMFSMGMFKQGTWGMSSTRT
jgi:hypothetical protein